MLECVHRLEERLPFIFIWLPEWFRAEHPEIVQALKINRNRLTNPYDLHLTLKHILELSDRTTKLPPAKSCESCQSLFLEMPWNRSVLTFAFHLGTMNFNYNFFSDHVKVRQSQNIGAPVHPTKQTTKMTKS